MNIDYKDNIIGKIKTMSYAELDELAQSLRTTIIETVSHTGGHLASNLGVVELTIALHKVFDTPKDKIIFDVGHQTYVHKILTGRYDSFSTLRQFGGISGFPKRAESVHDMFDSGHSGTSISACLGYAKARDLKKENYSCIAVIGDGSLTSGVAWEALNSAGTSKTPMIVILNDNEMSISNNVGGISKYLNTLRTSSAYIKIKQNIKDSGNTSLENGLKKIRDVVKYTLVKGSIFEELGFKYYGPIDGHNIEDLSSALEFAKKLNRPVLLHVITKKGKGFLPAEKNPAKYHGIGSFDIQSANSLTVRNKNSWSEIFGNELSNLAYTNQSIVAITAAMTDGTGLKEFSLMHPDRLFDAGIAEQHAVAFAEGLALNGLRPVVALYSTFVQRAYDQILSEVCLQNLPVVFAIDRAGITGQDGETHQGEFDIAYLKLVPNLTILSPSDEASLRAMLRYALSQNGPVAIRYPRGNAPAQNIYFAENQFEPKHNIIKQGSDVIIFSDGNMLSECLSASEILQDAHISCSVCDLRVLKPLDKDFILNECKKHKLAITVEDGCIQGGIGESISSIIASCPCFIKSVNLGWPNEYIEHGSVTQLREKYQLNAKAIAEKIREEYETTTGCTVN